jgi:hypothetical protein
MIRHFPRLEGRPADRHVEERLVMTICSVDDRTLTMGAQQALQLFLSSHGPDRIQANPEFDRTYQMASQSRHPRVDLWRFFSLRGDTFYSGTCPVLSAFNTLVSDRFTSASQDSASPFWRPEPNGCRTWFSNAFVGMSALAPRARSVRQAPIA